MKKIQLSPNNAHIILDASFLIPGGVFLVVRDNTTNPLARVLLTPEELRELHAALGEYLNPEVEKDGTP